MHVERVPASAPAVNPHEGVWNLLTRTDLRHVCCRDLPPLRAQLRRAKERLRHRTSVLLQCFAHAGCFLENVTLRSIKLSRCGKLSIGFLCQSTCGMKEPVETVYRLFHMVEMGES